MLNGLSLNEIIKKGKKLRKVEIQHPPPSDRLIFFLVLNFFERHLQFSKGQYIVFAQQELLKLGESHAVHLESDPILYYLSVVTNKLYCIKVVYFIMIQF